MKGRQRQMSNTLLPDGSIPLSELSESLPVDSDRSISGYISLNTFCIRDKSEDIVINIENERNVHMPCGAPYFAAKGQFQLSIPSGAALAILYPHSYNKNKN